VGLQLQSAATYFLIIGLRGRLHGRCIRTPKELCPSEEFSTLFCSGWLLADLDILSNLMGSWSQPQTLLHNLQ